VAKPNLTQPLVFEPIFMERVWGGRHLESLYGKRLPSAALIGESWEIVDRPEAQSVVHEGPLRGKTLHELWCKHRAEIFGNVPDSPRFPILCKLLDAQENLSLQVHPPRAIAKQLGGEPKSELWYIAHAAPKARLYAGVKKGTTRESFLKVLESGTTEKNLHAIEVKAGDAVFLPSGRMHALGGGIVLVEIQENSDTTYRIYDWDRTKKGRAARQLHITEAMQCLDFKDVEPALLQAKGESLVANELFEIEKWDLRGVREIAPIGESVIVCCLNGSFRCAEINLMSGEFCLIPASLPDRQLQPLAHGTTLLRIAFPALAVAREAEDG
jgi:mannose-6-phosphate isomerase